MREVTAANAATYLVGLGQVPEGVSVHAQELGGGVSNIVLRVDVEGRASIVLKQSRVQLRTRATWFSRLDRIWIEKAALMGLAGILPAGAVPDVLFEDRPNYLFAMSCAPDDSVVWKRLLLDGHVHLDVAQQAASILGTIHAETVGLTAVGGASTEAMVFDQLRIDPYYRQVALVHPDLKPCIQELIASLGAPVEKTFVHADFSPKNILVHSRGLTVVDFETAHAGDPAFDLGFFFSHLILKTIRGAQPERCDAARYLELIDTVWATYLDRVGLSIDAPRVCRAVGHLAACCLARVDGKSPVDYLEELSTEAVRRFAREVLTSKNRSWSVLRDILDRELRTIQAG